MYSANVLGVGMVVQHAIFHHTQGPIHLVTVHWAHTSLAVEKVMKMAEGGQLVGSPVHIQVDNKYRLADLVVAVWKDIQVHRVGTYSGKDLDSYGHETENRLHAVHQPSQQPPTDRILDSQHHDNHPVVVSDNGKIEEEGW